MGLAIEIWKVTKVQDVSFDFENKVLGLFPRIKLDDKKDYKDSGTKEFDRYNKLLMMKHTLGQEMFISGWLLNTWELLSFLLHSATVSTQSSTMSTRVGTALSWALAMASC